MKSPTNTHVRTGQIPILSDAFDALTSVVDRIPGSGWVKGAVKSGHTWIVQAAKDQPVLAGVVFTALGTQLASQLAQVAIPSVSGMQTVGPVIASVAFAVPGMAFKGESFTKAYVSDLSARVTALIAYVAKQKGGEAAAKLPEATAETQKILTEPLIQFVKDSGLQGEINRALSDFARQLQKEASQLTSSEAKIALERAGLDPVKLAARKGVRPDVAALGINALAGNRIYRVADPTPFNGVVTEDFDITGRPVQTPAAFDGDVAEQQQKLQRLGFLSTGTFVPGVLGERPSPTRDALRKFQEARGLRHTGDLDADTRAALDAALRPPPEPSCAELADAIQRVTQMGQAPVIINALKSRYRNQSCAERIQASATPVSVPQPLLPQLLTFAVLTSPAWFTFLVLPRVRARMRARTARRR